VLRRSIRQSRSPSDQTRKVPALRPIGRMRVFWKAATRHSPSRRTATSVWIEARSGAGPVLRRMTVLPLACITAVAPLFEQPRRSLARLFSPYTPEELEVILDFLTRSTERLRDETARLTATEPSGGPATR
jgi:hypothetical protein